MRANREIETCGRLVAKERPSDPSGVVAYPLVAPGVARIALRDPPRSVDQRRRQPAPLVGTEAEEAAWQLLRPFISPIDCNVFWQFKDARGEAVSGIRPLNFNTTMNALLNGEAVRLAYFTKQNFFKPCRGEAKYYYRSRWNGFAGTGYGSHANAWRKLNCDAKRFALDGKRVTSKNIALILLGFDVDCHHGELDVQKTTDLILGLFPGSYYEPSTNGQGTHLYVKLFYDINTKGSHHLTLDHIAKRCTAVGVAIEALRLSKGFDAPLDGIRGLPTQIGFDRDEDGQVIHISKTVKDGSPAKRPKLKVTCRCNVIKVPFYRNATEEAVSIFFDAPFYSLAHLEEVECTLRSDAISQSERPSQTTVDSNYLNEFLSIDSDGSEEPHTGYTHNNTNKETHNSVFPVRVTYLEAVRNLVAVQNSQERRVEFGMLLARHLHRVPSGQEILREYAAQGLQKADSKSDHDIRRFDQISSWLSQTFDHKKCRFDYGGYATERNKTEALITQRVDGLKLEWSKGDGNKPVSLAKLAALYWCMWHSQGRRGSTHFSEKQAKGAIRAVLQAGAHKAEVAAMFRILERFELIRKVGGYCPGQFGRGWVVGKLP